MTTNILWGDLTEISAKQIHWLTPLAVPVPAAATCVYGISRTFLAVHITPIFTHYMNAPSSVPLVPYTRCYICLVLRHLALRVCQARSVHAAFFSLDLQHLTTQSMPTHTQGSSQLCHPISRTVAFQRDNSRRFAWSRNLCLNVPNQHTERPLTSSPDRVYILTGMPGFYLDQLDFGQHWRWWSQALGLSLSG